MKEGYLCQLLRPEYTALNHDLNHDPTPMGSLSTPKQEKIKSSILKDLFSDLGLVPNMLRGYVKMKPGGAETVAAEVQGKCC